MKSSFTVLANAKINLHLEVCGKRADGYHNISSVMQSVTLCDKIRLSLSNTSGARMVTENKEISGDNLALLAAESFLREVGTQKGVEIALEKRIPLSAGLGGGSADAAAVLVGLNRMFEEPLTTDRLCELALPLGADVPFCIKGGTQIAEGLGEILTPIRAVPSWNVVLIKHHKKQSTGHMYSLLDSNLKDKTSTEAVISNLKKCDISALKENCINDFLSVSVDREEQEKICAELYERGAFLAGLSGSGPTIFALFEEEPNEAVIKELKNRYKEVYLCKATNKGVVDV